MTTGACALPVCPASTVRVQSAAKTRCSRLIWSTRSIAITFITLHAPTVRRCRRGPAPASSRSRPRPTTILPSAPRAFSSSASRVRASGSTHFSLSPPGLEPNTSILCRLPGSMGCFPKSPARRLHRDHASDRPRHERQVQRDIDGRTCRQSSGTLNIQPVSSAGPRAHLQLRTVNSSAELQAGRPDRHGSPRGPHLSCSTYCISRPYPV